MQMRPGGGKAKGASFERDVCSDLSRWVSRGKADDLFWRSAMSGGRATVARKKDKTLVRQAGDITATAPEGAALTDWFYIECKFVKDLRLASFLLGDVGVLAEYWRVAVREAAAHGRSPMLIAKQNKMPTFVLINDGRWTDTVSWARSPLILTHRPLQVRMLDYQGMVACRWQNKKESSLL